MASRKPRAALEGEPLRGRIPTLQAAQAEALRALCASQRCWPLQGERILAMAPLRRVGDGAGTFELDADGTRMALRIDRGDAHGSAPQWSDYAGRSRLLAWSLANEQTLAQLSEGIGAPLLPVSESSADDAAQGEGVWLSFSIEDMYEPEGGGESHYRSGDLRVPAAWLSRMLGRSEPLDPDHPLPDLSPWQSLPARVSVGCAGPALSAADFASLRPGDVVVLGSRRQPPALHATTSGRRWPLRTHADGCEIAGAMQTVSTSQEKHPMQSSDETAATTGAAAAGDAKEPGDAAARALPVQVEFELGKVELTLGELAGLQPGYVFALPAFVEGANVTIRANGRASGRGELVAVGDTLGVRLVSWN